MRVISNKRESNTWREWVPDWVGSNTETAGGEGCVDPWNRQQIGVGYQRVCWN